MIIKCIALDDEPLSMEIIQAFSNQTEGIELLGCFTDAQKASDFMKAHDVHLIFLDIQMPDMNGLDFYQRYGSGKMVIFTTAYSESVTCTPIWASGEPIGPMLKGMMYMVRPFIQPSKRGLSVAFISFGETQLLVGPASSFRRLQI